MSLSCQKSWSVQLFLFFSFALTCSSSFYYPNFNDTSALRLNGDAGTSSCGDGGAYVYAVSNGLNDGEGGGLGLRFSETSTTRIEGVSKPYSVLGARETSRYLSGFGQRDAHSASPDNSTGPCPMRLRLSPSRAFKQSSVILHEALPILSGWETGFTFQVSDPSLQCTYVKDATFGAASHRACTVAGGDGLAFILHGDVGVGSAALGTGGGGLGYGGLPNALAVEFDTWYNAGSESGDLPFDHITVQASPVGGAWETGVGTPTVTSGTTTRVSGPPLRANIGDGLLHTVRIAYYPYLKLDFLSRFVGSTALPQFLTADGERRKVGTLAVWYDEVDPLSGEVAGFEPTSARNDTLLPTLAIPLNLNAVLRVPGGVGWVGFTAATGSIAWQKHDILSWYWTDES